VAWTATASEMIAKREYRYLSPSFLFHPKTKHIV
jgi:phage I-like protein